MYARALEAEVKGLEMQVEPRRDPQARNERSEAVRAGALPHAAFRRGDQDSFAEAAAHVERAQIDPRLEARVLSRQSYAGDVDLVDYERRLRGPAGGADSAGRPERDASARHLEPVQDEAATEKRLPRERHADTVGFEPIGGSVEDEAVDLRGEPAGDDAQTAHAAFGPTRTAAGIREAPKSTLREPPQSERAKDRGPR